MCVCVCVCVRKSVKLNLGTIRPAVLLSVMGFRVLASCDALNGRPRFPAGTEKWGVQLLAKSISRYTCEGKNWNCKSLGESWRCSCLSIWEQWTVYSEYLNVQERFCPSPLLSEEALTHCFPCPCSDPSQNREERTLPEMCFTYWASTCFWCIWGGVQEKDLRYPPHPSPLLSFPFIAVQG